MTTPILQIPEIAGSQLNQYITANEMVRKLEASANECLTVSLSAGDVTLTNEQFFRAYFFIASGHSVARNMIIPQSKRSFSVKNAGSAEVSVVLGSSSIAIPSGQTFALMADGQPNGLSVVGGGAAGGLTGFVAGKNNAAPNNVLPVSYINADDPGSHVDIALVPKGNGALMLSVPNSLSSGGNKRGSKAIDLQLSRSAANQVASGFASIAIGESNRSDNTSSIAVGSLNVASGYLSVALGYNCLASAQSSFAAPYESQASGVSAVALGSGCVAGGPASLALGFQATTLTTGGKVALSNGRFNANGDSQISGMILRGATSGAETINLTYDRSGLSSSNHITLTNSSVFSFRGTILARHNSSGDASVWEFKGAITRGASAGTVALLGTVTPVLIGASAGASSWAVSVTAGTTHGGINVSVTGEAGKNIRWMCDLRCAELSGGL